VLHDYAQVRQGRRPATLGAPAKERVVSAVTARELNYWRLLTRAWRQDAPAGPVDAESTGAPAESAWRLAAAGSLAAQRAGARARAEELRAQAVTALAQLRAEWKDGARGYEARPDLVELRREAGLER
jgi:hypothetical protein